MPASTGPLSEDARSAHQRLSRHAEALAALSASFSGEALIVAEAYASALGGGGRESWIAFVAAASMVAEHSASVASIIELSPREQEARAFFAQIVRENDDLLETGALAVN